VRWIVIIEEVRIINQLINRYSFILILIKTASNRLKSLHAWLIGQLNLVEPTWHVLRQLVHFIGGEWMPTREHLIVNYTQWPYIGLIRVALSSIHYLRRHVKRSPAHSWRNFTLCILQVFGKAEIGYPYLEGDLGEIDFWEVFGLEWIWVSI